jgi:hypothetical protein
VVKLKIHVFAYKKWPDLTLKTVIFCALLVQTPKKFKSLFGQLTLAIGAYILSKYFFLERFGQYLKSQKMDFPLYFQILRGRVPGFIFMLEC